MTRTAIVETKVIFLTMLFLDRKSTRLNSSHSQISYAVFCLKKKNSQTGPAAVSIPCDESPHHAPFPPTDFTLASPPLLMPFDPSLDYLTCILKLSLILALCR